MKHKIALLIALIVGYCVFVFAPASTLLAQPMRYEYRATPIENGPITVPCFVVDRFNFLCIETGTIFVDVAAARLVSFEDARGSAPVHRFTGYGSFLSAAATPRIILAHQKIAIDAWVDRTKNKKGERCCDAGKDCHSLNPEEVKHVPGGVNIRLGEQTLFIPGEEIMPSEDGRYWVCYWNNQVKCFFAPYSGS